MYFQIMHIRFFPNLAITNNIKFLNFPKDIHAARQEKFFVHIFSSTL